MSFRLSPLKSAIISYFVLFSMNSFSIEFLLSFCSLFVVQILSSHLKLQFDRGGYTYLTSVFLVELGVNYSVAWIGMKDVFA